MESQETLILAVEIGGTKLQLGLCTPDGQVHKTQRGESPADQGAQGILAWLSEHIPAFLRHDAVAGGVVRAIGVGFGGPVDVEQGTALVSHQVEGWNGFPLRDWFESRYGIPCTVANDSNAAGWGEYILGMGQGTQHFFYSNIGSGIGGALVLHGKLYNGQGRGGGDVGHIYVPDWTTDAPGAADKLEHICSGWSIERRIRQWHDLPEESPLFLQCGGKPDTLTCAMLGRAAQDGDTRAKDEIERVAQTLGIGLATIVTLVHPERIAIGGGVAQMGEVLFEPVRSVVDAHVFGPYRGRYEIGSCVLGETVVLAGAALLAGEQLHE